MDLHNDLQFVTKRIGKHRVNTPPYRVTVGPANIDPNDAEIRINKALDTLIDEAIRKEGNQKKRKDHAARSRLALAAFFFRHISTWRDGAGRSANKVIRKSQTGNVWRGRLAASVRLRGTP